MERIKDELAHNPEPLTLAEFRQEVLRIDDRYCACEYEKRRSSGKQSSGGNKDKGKKPQNSTANNSQLKSTPNTQSSMSNASTSGSSASANVRNNSSNNSGKRNNNQKSGKSNNRGSFSHLGPDGKLTQAEKDRRRKNNLCLFCGGSGHSFDNCPNWKDRNSKDSHGRVTTVETSSVPTISDMSEK